ncbi:MAG: cupin domain-containing protein [Solirubrobacteraceae bacterium]
MEATVTTSTDEQILVGGLAIRPRMEPAESGGAVAIHEFDVPAGASLPVPHSHDAYDETIYGVRGTVTFTVEGTAHDIGPGETLFIARGAIHAFANTGSTDATALAIISPGLLGADYFREMAAIMDAAAGGPPDFAAIGDVMRRHGLTPVSPNAAS